MLQTKENASKESKNVGRKSRTKPTKKGVSKASHDIVNPPALLDFMMQGWKEPSRKLPAKVKGAEEFAARRKRLSGSFKGETLVIPTGHEKVRANDTNYRFRPGTDFFYLTGNNEADCVLVLTPKGRSGHTGILFVEPNPGRSEPTFFTDRHKGELWVGPRLGIEQSQHRYQVEECRPLGELKAFLKELKASRKYRVVRGIDEVVDRVLPRLKEADAELSAILSELRLIKNAGELRAIKNACGATLRGFEDIIAALPTAKNERDVEAAFSRRARVEGNDVGYNIIAASGANACILHWGENNARLNKRELLLVDAGVESHELYTADITRTLPMSGKFSKEQREIYDLVQDAQEAAFAAVKPGNMFLDPHWAAMRVLAEGLERLKLLPCSAEEALKPENQFYKRFTLHGTSHMLGMDVHDCSHARADFYRNGVLEPGMVLTIEPGLYFQNDDLTVPPRYRGIGVRIEDDVVVTTRGRRLLSADIPRTSEDVERWMKEVWAC